ncbi:allantoate amidohydrolase [Allonocardiopsis opalescens]|uniref:N-carbamoyl-L-amino-acid hydrolase n=1 Tax=Allonocardiopsis opalescens TaxID=1144618 RepID=A0A2T0PUG9_9ACTN|nr:allantoate amidohydrolase [Allonocardiopsis opalescens]PRX92552.1 N-carbamoyl-L-amino-acid hydrolase [Allonocardiopsis opalescens]
MTDTFDELWQQLAPVGRFNQTGGYRRYSWTSADAEARAWFGAAAAARGLDVEHDRNGNLWAWWRDERTGEGDAVVTGSHLDSVPDGGAFDGPLGIVSALAAVDLLRERGARPVRPVGVVVFAEEEGARFGRPCLGSRLLTGAIDPAAARELSDADGITWAEAMNGAGLDPAGIGPDPERLARVGTFVELHVEQGRALSEHNRPVGVAGSVWPHGRWRLDFTGKADHAGTTRLADRCDPMLPLAQAVLAARAEAETVRALATVGRVQVRPNSTNAIPSSVQAWLDARAPDEPTLEVLLEGITTLAAQHAEAEGVDFEITAESVTPETLFPAGLRDRVAGTLDGAPVLATGAGHDAGILAGHVPTAMLFVRNPTGVSHAPDEHAETADCHAGVTALADVLQELACRA